MAEKTNYGLIDLLMEKHNVDYSFYDIEKKTGIRTTTLDSANKKRFSSFTGRLFEGLALYCNEGVGCVTDDLYNIDQVFYSNLETIEEDLVKNHDQGATYNELKEILPEIVKNVAKTEVESKAYMYQLNKFIKQFKD